MNKVIKITNELLAMEPQPYIKQTGFNDRENRAFPYPVNATFFPQACDTCVCVCVCSLQRTSSVSVIDDTSWNTYNIKV